MPARLGRIRPELVLVVVVFGLGLACADRGDSRSPPQVPSGELPNTVNTEESAIRSAGDSVTSGTWQFTVTKVEQQPSVEWSSLGNVAEAQGIWTVVHLRVENLGTTSAALRTSDLQVRDANGRTYPADERISLYYSAYHRLSKPSGNYPPSRPVEVGLVFDVPADVTGLQLYAVQAQKSIDLGR